MKYDRTKSKRSQGILTPKRPEKSKERHPFLDSIAEAKILLKMEADKKLLAKQKAAET